MGDKFTFGGNKTHHSHSFVGRMAENRGLWLTGPSKQVKFVLLNPNQATTKHYKEAKLMGQKVIDPDEFESYLRKVCKGSIPKESRKPNFKECLGSGKRVYLLDLTPTQAEVITKTISKSGAKVTKIRKKSLSCVVTQRSKMRSGKADLFRYLEVPIFAYENLK